MTRGSNYQLILVLLVTLLLVNSVALFAGQISYTNSDAAEVPGEGFKHQENYVSSYIPHDPITITSNANFSDYGFPGSGTPETPYVLSDYSITTTGVCISIQDTDAYFVIRDCLLTGGTSYDGISLNNVDYGEIRNNTITNKNYGISILSSSNNITLVNNTISGNIYGVSIYSSSSNILMNNTIVENMNTGLDIAYSSWNNTVVDNTISEYFRHDNSSFTTIANNILSSGVSLSSSSNNTVVNNSISSIFSGLQIGHYSHYNTAIGNNITGCDGDGVSIGQSSFNILLNNTIVGNGFADYGEGVGIRSYSNSNILANNIISGNRIGIYMPTTSINNFFYLNVIAHNSEWNAVIDGPDNSWNTTGMGNYWSDYTGSGVYTIQGDAGAIDYHPNIYPPDTVPPTIDHPADVEFIEDTIGNYILWTPFDVYPRNYVVYQNDTVERAFSWSGNPIAIDLDLLSIGGYNFTIVVYDLGSNSVSDTVLVIVHPQNVSTLSTTTTIPATNTTTTTTTTTTAGIGYIGSLGLGLIGVSAIVVLVFLILKRTSKRNKWDEYF